MRLPIIPFVVAAALLGAVWYWFSTKHSVRRTMEPPRLSRLADIDGIETEVAVSPDGTGIAVIASGDLWILNPATGNRKQLTRTPETEWLPSWMPDGQRLGCSRGTN